jgi:hypothetical protein
MEFTLPKYITDLCSKEYMNPFSYYVKRDSWSLHADRIEKTFLNKKGVYCFWWSGKKEVLLNETNDFSYNDCRYSLNEQCVFDHGMIPLYVGMTAKAAEKVGRGYNGRMIDRLITFPNIFRLNKKGNRFALCKRKTATWCDFDLFNFPEKIRATLATERTSPNLTLEQAELLLIDHPVLIERFAKEYKDLVYDNYTISFVEFTDEVEMFYAEALAIGYLRPWFNHS